MSGHVFVTRGDLRRLHCDAWLLPTDAGLGVTHGWLEDQGPGYNTPLPLPTLQEQLDGRRSMLRPAGWSNHGVRVMPLTAGQETASEPKIYLVNVGGVQGMPVEWYMEGVRQFVETAAAHAQGAARVTRRTRPLVGLPLVGTGQGGADDIKGDVVRRLLATLREEAARHNLDIALVLDSAAALAVAQHERWRAGDDDPWPDLNERLRQTAVELAGHADDGRLVLFLGAGVSRGAGLPSWDELLAGLAQDAGMDEHERSIKALLRNLEEGATATPAICAEQAWRPIEDLLKRYHGGPMHRAP